LASKKIEDRKLHKKELFLVFLCFALDRKNIYAKLTDFLPGKDPYTLSRGKNVNLKLFSLASVLFGGASCLILNKING
jgi:hypothetical protein